MRKNPLFYFIESINPKINESIEYSSTKEYLIIKCDAIGDSPQLFPESTSIQRHLRIDKFSKILEEKTTGPFSSNLSPAHYTERYIQKDSNDQLCLHVYLNLKGQVLRVVAKNETQNDKQINLSSQQQAAVTQRTKWAKSMLNKLIKLRNTYIEEISKSCDLDEKLSNLYESLKRQAFRKFKRTSAQLLPIMEQIDQLSYGQISPQTKFIQHLIKKFTTVETKIIPNTQFSLLSGDEDNAIEDKMPPAPQPHKKPLDKVADKQEQKIAQTMTMLAETLKTCQMNTLALHEYHTNHCQLIADYHSLQHSKQKLSKRHQQLLDAIKATLSLYQSPHQQLLEYANNADIVKLDELIAYMGGPAEKYAKSLLVHFAPSHFEKISDQALCELLRYFYTCDKFSDPEELFNSILVAHPEITFNLKQMLLIGDRFESFLTMTELMPNAQILSPGLKFSTIRLLCIRTNPELIMQYISKKGATHAFGHMSKDLALISHQIKHNPRFTPHELETSAGRKKVRKMKRNVKKLAATYQLNDPNNPHNHTRAETLLDCMHDHGQLQKLVAHTQLGTVERDAIVKEFCTGYINSTGPLHACLHANFVLSRKSTITTRLIISSSPGMSYFHSEQESRTQLYITQLLRKNAGIPLDQIPAVFVSLQWFANISKTELTTMMDFCYEMLSHPAVNNQLDEMIKALSDTKYCKKLLGYYRADVVFTTFMNVIDQKNTEIFCDSTLAVLIKHRDVIIAASDAASQCKLEALVMDSPIYPIELLHAAFRAAEENARTLYRFALMFKRDCLSSSTDQEANQRCESFIRNNTSRELLQAIQKLTQINQRLNHALDLKSAQKSELQQHLSHSLSG